MNNRPEPVLHIGYHKTGTTWMQRVLFHPDFGFAQVTGHEEVYRCITAPHAFEFDAPATVAHFAPLIARVPEGTVPVISSEILSGHPFYGGRRNVEFAHRLRALFPRARIVVTIREQVKIIASVYMQYLSRCGTKPPEAFFRETETPGYESFSAIHFCYHHLVGLYRDLFGVDRVLVLTQEEMAGDLAGFIGKAAMFADATPRVAIPPRTAREAVSNPEFAYPILRRINHFRADSPSAEPVLDLGPAAKLVYRSVGKLARLDPVRRRLGHHRPVTTLVQDRFGMRFAESNRALKDMLGEGVDLDGYTMAPALDSI